MKASDFYGTSETVGVGASTSAALEVPSESKPIGVKPVHFWLAMVGLLVLARVLYEASEKVS